MFATTVSDNETAIRKCEEDEEGYDVCFEYLKNAQLNLGDKNFNNCIVFALYSYDALNDDELSFKCFDQLVVLDKNEDEEKGDANDGWWTCKLANGNKEGLVPKNYLGVCVFEFFFCRQFENLILFYLILVVSKSRKSIGKESRRVNYLLISI